MRKQCIPGRFFKRSGNETSVTHALAKSQGDVSHMDSVECPVLVCHEQGSFSIIL